jgi:hypothetical protein
MIVELDGLTSETTPEYVVTFEVVTVEVSAALSETFVSRPSTRANDTVEAILFIFMEISLSSCPERTRASAAGKLAEVRA